MKKILIVDDEAHILNIIKFNLKKRGYDITIASNGEEAIEKIKGNIPDLLIIDVMMPKMSGYDVCRILKEDEKYKDMPIIMLSAKSQLEDIEVAKELGITKYLTKPFSPMMLMKKVVEIIGEA